MTKIVAVGGGEIGRPKENGKGFYPIETMPIDREIIRLTSKRNPKLLFIPTASGDSKSYFEAVKNYFGKKLKCECNVLYLINNKLTFSEIRKRVIGSDIIYVGGGNTLYMLNVWKKVGLDKILHVAYKQNKILCGVSAGAICWFRYSTSDSRPKSGKENYGYIRVAGLDFLPLTVSPHHTREINRRKALIKIMNRTSGVGIALDDCSALEIIDDKYRIISSKKSARAHKVYFKGKNLHYEKIEKSIKFRPLKELMGRDKVA